MLGLRGLLYLALGGLTAFFSAGWGRRLWTGRRAPPGDAGAVGLPGGKELAVGFATDFLDTLGIGSFAPTTSLFRLLRLVPDGLIPGTLLVGHALPTIAQAFIYITIVEVETTTLVALIAAAVAGSWLGAALVSGWPKRAVQLGMGIALLGAAAIMVVRQLGFLPGGGALVGLSGGKLVAGLAGNFLLGALMTIGIGSYSPSLILFGLLGMNLKSVFPVMMGSCAFLMPVSGFEFVRRGRYAPRAALGLTLAGVPGVLLAAFVVRELPLAVLTWLVVAVVVYTAVAMLRAALRGDAAPAAPPPP